MIDNRTLILDHGKMQIILHDFRIWFKISEQIKEFYIANTNSNLKSFNFTVFISKTKNLLYELVIM